MKILIVISAVSAAGFTAVICPVLLQRKVIAKRATPEMIRRSEKENARIVSALTALREANESKMPEVRSVIASLPKYEHRCPQFAELLARRGEVMAAFKLERSHAHFNEYNVPDDREMSLYASLADKVGNPHEAAWARQRMGVKGHFRVWKSGTLSFLASAYEILHRAGRYEDKVNSFSDDALRFYPGLQSEIEAMRKNLLTASLEDVESMYRAVLDTNRRPPIKTS